jgi:hypothetical protein
MVTIEVNPAALEAAANSLVDAGPVYMVNVLVGTAGEAWDDIVIVRYASFATLRRILENPAYEKTAAPHRRAALADWKFMITTQPELPR